MSSLPRASMCLNRPHTLTKYSFYIMVPSTTGQKLSEEISVSRYEADEETVTEGNCSRRNKTKKPEDGALSFP